MRQLAERSVKYSRIYCLTAIQPCCIAENYMIAQVAQRGNLTLPADLRGKYNIQAGDTFTIIPLEDDQFLLIKGRSYVDKVADRLKRQLEAKGMTLEEMLKQASALRHAAT